MNKPKQKFQQPYAVKTKLNLQRNPVYKTNLQPTHHVQLKQWKIPQQTEINPNQISQNQQKPLQLVYPAHLLSKRKEPNLRGSLSNKMSCKSWIQEELAEISLGKLDITIHDELQKKKDMKEALSYILQNL